jgi:methyl-accepting chemotaxis protein
LAYRSAWQFTAKKQVRDTVRAYLDPKMADSTPAQAPARAGGWRISGRMQEIDSCATAVSVAVEEQSSATAEISQNVTSASDGAKIVVSVLGFRSRGRDAAFG